MRRSHWMTLALAFGASGAMGATLDDLLARQRDGLWELRPPAGNAMRFCVTDESKRAARAQMLAVMQGMGCRYLTDRAQNERFEVVARCASSDPNLGTFQVHASGTAKVDQWLFAAKLHGGGPTVQKLAANPAWSGTVQWRRLGACRPGAARGLQPPS